MSDARQRGGVVAAVLIVLVLIGAAAAGGLYLWADARLSAGGPLDEPLGFVVERGDTPDRVAERLADAGAFADPGADERLFALEARRTDLAASLRAGEFELPAGASIRRLMNVLRDAKPVLRFVTVPEGRTTAQAVALVEAAPHLTGEVTLDPPEGALLPETYDYQRGEPRDAVVERMMAAHNEALAELWPDRAEDLPITTPEEAVILASIVEKETALPEERPLVAAVFVNRLRRGMRLQSDPTIIYGLTGGEPLGRGIRRSELDGETPYNTYQVDGLPPTPIANPGRASLAAVLNPAETDALYFVADGTGGHVFADSLAEHNRNVAAWRRIERERREERMAEREATR